MTDAERKWAEEYPKIVAQARAAFGHIAGRSDAECLALAVSHLRGLADERNSALNLNASQAQQIARMSAENDRLRSRLTEHSK